MNEKIFVPNLVFLIIGLCLYTWLVIIIEDVTQVIILLFTILFLGWSMSFGKFEEKKIKS